MAYGARGRRIPARWAAIVCALLGAYGAVGAVAQEPPPDPAAVKNGMPRSGPGKETAAQSPAAPALQEEPALHFRDVDGTLKPVPGIDYTQLRKLIDLQSRLSQVRGQPAYTLHQVFIEAQVRGERVEIKVDLELGTRGTEWVRVPLRLGECALLQQPVYSNERQFVHFHDAQGGYDWWVRPSGGDDREQRHRLSLSLVSPLETAAGESRLRLTAPRSNQSRIRLVVPGDHVLGTVLGGKISKGPDTPAAVGTTEFLVEGLDGLLTLSWHPRPQTLLKTSRLLRSETQVKCRFDPKERMLLWDASVTVRSFGGEFERFQVRLPPGARLTKTDPRFVEIQPGQGGAGDLVLVQHAPTTDRVQVRLEVARDCANLRPNDLVDLAGFEVPGAVRQWGYLALQVEPGWHFRWEPLPRQIVEIAAATAPEMLRGKDVFAVFELSAQPASLRAVIYRTEPRVRVESQYTVDVQADRCQLRGVLRYAIDRAQVAQLAIDMADWELERIEPAELIDASLSTDLRTGVGKDLLIPLKQPAEGGLELTITARRAHTPGANPLTIPLPAPQAQSVQQRVTFRPAANVVLVPRAEAIVGLVRDTAASPADASGLSFRGESKSALFVADFRVNARRVQTRVRSQVEFTNDSLKVTQRFYYLVAFEPLSEIAVLIPEPLLNNATLALELDGQPLQGAPDSDARDPAEAKPAPEAGPVTARWRFALPTPRPPGTLEVLVRYSVPRERLPSDQSVPLAMPLVMPADGVLAENTLAVAAPTGMEVDLRGGQWSLLAKDDAASVPATARAEWRSTQAEQEALVVARLQRHTANGTTVVEKALVRTFYSANGREDWLFFRIASTQEFVELKFPPEVEAVITLAVDGKPVPLANGAKQVRLSWNGRGGETLASRLVEVRYLLRDRLRTAYTQKSLLVAWPTASAVHRVWWQLNVPEDQHLLWSSDDWTREHAWRWQRTHFERTPLATGQELNAWCGVPAAADADGAGGNRYLFSTLGEPPVLKLVLLRRTWAVAGCSLAALVLCFAWMAVPLLRRPAVLLMLAAAIASAAAVFPDPAIFVAQAAGIGIVCGAAGMLMRRGVQPAPPLRAPSGASSIMDRSATQPMVRLNVQAPASTPPGALTAEVRA